MHTHTHTCTQYTPTHTQWGKQLNSRSGCGQDDGVWKTGPPQEWTHLLDGLRRQQSLHRWGGHAAYCCLTAMWSCVTDMPLTATGTASAAIWTIKFKGRLFHSGLPHRGINSIELASEAMAYIQRRFYEDFPPVSVCGVGVLHLWVRCVWYIMWRLCIYKSPLPPVQSYVLWLTDSQVSPHQ